jgi:hypothetical protein
VVRCSEGHNYSCISLIVVPASKQRCVAALTLSFRQPTLNSERNLKGKHIFHYQNPFIKRQRCHMCYYRFHYKILFLSSSFWYQNYHTVAATMMLYTFCTCIRGGSRICGLLYIYVIIELLCYILNLLVSSKLSFIAATMMLYMS